MSKASVKPDARVKQRIMHAEDARFVFVRVYGCTWIRVDSCVARIACPYPGCKAKAGEPCSGSGGQMAPWMTSTHWMRKKADADRAKKARRGGR